MSVPVDDTPLEVGDVVAMRVPRAPWGADPFGAVERIENKRSEEPTGDPVTLVWVAMDDGTGDQPFLLGELVKVDMKAWEAKHAGPWRCKCDMQVQHAGERVVCPKCGRARPWR